MCVFKAADILLPKVEDMSKWAVIACDQFTSDPAYWQRVREHAAGAPSTIELILPEVELGGENEASRIAAIHETMDRYLESALFTVYQNSLIYVERTLEDGSIRKGLVGMVDLDAYDYAPGSVSAIRATEKTVVERIPPRMKVRRAAPLELPHILMLCDDHDKKLIEPITGRKEDLPVVYDTELMEDGGHITGYLVQGDVLAAFEAALADYAAHVDEKYEGLPGVPMLFAVGDGNHSLATAKACYEELKAAHPGEDLSDHPARYALVELENIHDEAQVFEPIHRVVFKTDVEKLLKDIEAVCASDGFPVKWYSGDRSGTIFLDRAKSQLAVGALQSFLDCWLQENAGEVDYIHDDPEVCRLAQQEGAVGFLLPAMEKSQLFRGVIADGILPRKTFSMGHAREKRYYLEGRVIK